MDPWKTVNARLTPLACVVQDESNTECAEDADASQVKTFLVGISASYSSLAWKCPLRHSRLDTVSTDMFNNGLILWGKMSKYVLYLQYHKGLYFLTQKVRTFSVVTDSFFLRSRSVWTNFPLDLVSLCASNLGTRLQEDYYHHSLQ